MPSVCAVCLLAEVANPNPAVTSIRATETCAPHVGDAANLANPQQPAPFEDASVQQLIAWSLDWLGQLDPEELQNAALDRVSDFGAGKGAQGRAFVGVLTDSLKEMQR